ncbi:hypothetical protein [Woodsholea maritima]|uniref:hypothetical protein n=1 Tax=Woodsholea maritima TaxID=240237 RepID=UPI0003616ED1|nr:hypothetical protein [Woodsholea maritima]
MNEESLIAMSEQARDGLEPLRQAGEDLRAVMHEIGGALKTSLEDAARSGEVSFARLGRELRASLVNLALDQVIAPGLDQVFHRLRGGLGLDHGASRSSPMGFEPRSRINEAMAPISIVVNHQGGPLQGIEASENQIAAAIARAVQRGMTRL